jgi:dipeptidyl aminopeptidase/acylaminoacyl peptidase
MRALIFLFFFALSAFLPASAAPPPAPRPAEHFARLPFISDPKLSPDGTKIAGKVASNGRQMLGIFNLAGGAGSRTFVAMDEVDLNWWEWVNEDWLVAGVGASDKPLDTPIYFRRAIGISADGSQIKTLVGYRAAQAADDVIWIARDGTPRILLSIQTSMYIGMPGFWPAVYEVDVATGKYRQVVEPSTNIRSWYADAAGVVRMGVGIYGRSRTSFMLYRPKKNDAFKMVERASPRRGEKLVVPALFTSNPARAVASSDHEGFDALYELDLNGMALGARIFGIDGFDLDEPISNPAGDALQGVYYTDTRRRVKWFDPDLALVQSQIDSAVNGRQADIVSMSRDRQRLIVRLGGADQAGRFYYFDRADGRMRFMADVSEDFGAHAFAPVSTVKYKARDGLDIAAVLTVPAGREAKNLPLILMPHGGPFFRDSEQWDWWAQFLADRGYAVLQPNYRGSSGFGTAFAGKGRGQWGLAMQDDLDDGVAWAVASGLADRGRVCIVGASYGGYAALRAASRGGSIYRCAVSYAGVSDLAAMVRYDSRFLDGRSRANWLEEQAPDFRAVSPINRAGSFSIPTLIMHGKKDRTVLVGQSREMAEKLEKAGKVFTYIEQPEADHYFSREADRLQFLTELEAFLKKHNPA